MWSIEWYWIVCDSADEGKFECEFSSDFALCDAVVVVLVCFGVCVGGG